MDRLKERVRLVLKEIYSILWRSDTTIFPMRNWEELTARLLKAKHVFPPDFINKLELWENAILSNNQTMIDYLKQIRSLNEQNRQVYIQIKDYVDNNLH